MHCFWPGKAFYAEFATHSLTTGAAAAADALPTAVVARNGAADGTVTAVVAAHGTGWYGVGFTVPAGYSVYDTLTVRVTALVGGVEVHHAINASCPVPPDVAGLSFVEYMRSICGDAFGTTAPSGNQVQFRDPAGTPAHTVTYGAADGTRTSVSRP